MADEKDKAHNFGYRFGDEKNTPFFERSPFNNNRIGIIKVKLHKFPSEHDVIFYRRICDDFSIEYLALNLGILAESEQGRKFPLTLSECENHDLEYLANRMQCPLPELIELREIEKHFEWHSVLYRQ